jgi:hypothetical protein
MTPKKSQNLRRFIGFEGMRPMDSNIYEKVSIQQVREGTTKIVCVGCGEDDTRLFQSHHIYGKTNSNDIIPLCLNCHTLVTLNQNKSSPSARSPSANDEQKLGFMLVSVGSLLERIGKNLKNYGYGLISDE